ncbi:MAG: hypothetical protein ACRC4N_14570 [Gammaproteobacteria bacterium]
MAAAYERVFFLRDCFLSCMQVVLMMNIRPSVERSFSSDSAEMRIHGALTLRTADFLSESLNAWQHLPSFSLLDVISARSFPNALWLNF